MNNIDAFDEAAGEYFAQLYAAFPVRIELSTLSPELKTAAAERFVKPTLPQADSIDFEKHETNIRLETRDGIPAQNEASVYWGRANYMVLRGACLTAKGLEALRATPTPNVPLSHPFVERLIGTIRREFLDHVPFWTSTDLERKLESFGEYYNQARTHRSLYGATPIRSPRERGMPRSIKWQRHRRGLYELPIAA